MKNEAAEANAKLAAIRSQAHNGKMYERSDVEYMLALAVTAGGGLGAIAPQWFRDQAKLIAGTLDQLAAVIAERDETRRRLLSAAGDDLCRLTQEEIKAMSAGAVKIPPKEEFLASCERFHAQVAGEAGVMHNCLTLAQLIAENERLTAVTAELTRLRGLLKMLYDRTNIIDNGRCVICRGQRLWTSAGPNKLPLPCENPTCTTHEIDAALAQGDAK